MKTVFPTREVAHVWAARTQDAGRSPGNFYFTGLTLYSYGPHYVVAHFMPDAYAVDGKTLCLLNSRSYSNTTSKHQAHAWRAIDSHVTATLHVNGLSDGDVRYIERHGCAELVRGRIVHGMHAQAEAATKKGIRQTTRNEQLRILRGLRADAVQLLTADIARKDLDAKFRAASRSVLTHAVGPAVPDEGADRDACIAYASALMRGEYRKKAVDYAARLLRELDSIATASTRANDNNARQLLAHFKDADMLRDSFAEHAKRAGMATPRAVSTALRAFATLRKAWEPRALASDRVRMLAEFAELRETIETARRDEGIAAVSRDVEKLAHTERALRVDHDPNATPAELDAAQARREYVADLQRQMRESEKRDDAQRAADAFKRAQDAESRGDVPVMQDNARSALHYARRSGVDTADMQALSDRADAARDEWDRTVQDKWRNREVHALARDAARCFDGGSLLRLTADGKRIETSHGATVSARVAPLLWRVVCAARSGADVSRYIGARVGHYNVRDITAEHVAIGCHDIYAAELDRMASRMGLTPCECTAAPTADIVDALSALDV